ncbi:MAG: glycosyltransferase [Elusimicrobia bacterium]|nr:glycosyltransferase [Elusimicrobiota bacterium]
MHEKICLIIPCYNEEKRLDMDAFKEHCGECRFLFVDDGSTDRTSEIIRQNLSDDIALLQLKSNAGKAEAVRQGMLYALEKPPLCNAEWFGYWDADLAAPLTELKRFLAFAEMFGGEVDAILGSRIAMLGSLIKRRRVRHLTGRAFALAAGLLLNIKTHDSQCGAKIFRREIIERAFSEKFISKWLFDIEALLRLKDCNIIECPLKTWRDKDGGNLKVAGDLPRILLDLIKIKLKYR